MMFNTLSFSLLLLATSANAATFCERYLTNVTQREIELALENSPVTKIISMKEHLESIGKRYTGSENVYFVELENDLRAVLKTDDSASADGEVAASRISEFIEVQLVPPTTYRTYDGKLGSIQLYINTSKDLTENGNFRSRFESMSEKSKSDAKIFQFILGQWGDHSGNLLIDDLGEPILIDNANIHMLQHVRFGSFPFVRRGRSIQGAQNEFGAFPFDTATELKNPSLEELSEKMGSYLTGERIQFFHSQIQSMPEQTICYVIWNGSLWVSSARVFRKPAYTEVFSKQTIKGLKKLNNNNLKNLLPSTFTKVHIEGILDRINQVLTASKKGRLIP